MEGSLLSRKWGGVTIQYTSRDKQLWEERRGWFPAMAEFVTSSIIRQGDGSFSRKVGNDGLWGGRGGIDLLLGKEQGDNGVKKILRSGRG